MFTRVEVLYVILVLSFLALVGVAIASYLRVRKHMKNKSREESDATHKHS